MYAIRSYYETQRLSDAEVEEGREVEAAPVVRASAMQLPLRDNSFDAPRNNFV